MTRSRRAALQLTRELIDARFPEPVLDRSETMSELSDEAIRSSLEQTLRTHGEEHLHLFAYGSLMWKPDLVYDDKCVGRVEGYHRRFCLWQKRSRGNRHNPNLMMALDAGGSCCGVVYRVTGPDIESKVSATWRRELVGDGYRPRWVSAKTATGALRAVTFVANRANVERYTGRLPDEVVAGYIAEACGERGSGAEYLLETVLALERLDLRDSRLWRLQRLVAERLRR